ncbi:MAG TPA: hypothetical protein VFD30_04990 [Terriglobia bacterium]|nr:hypothetical protein [Terriglobia bacterium]
MAKGEGGADSRAAKAGKSKGGLVTRRFTSRPRFPGRNLQAMSAGLEA